MNLILNHSLSFYLALKHRNSAQSQQPKSSSVKLGDKVIVIPDPEGFEEQVRNLKTSNGLLPGMETGAGDNLLLHIPASDCERMRTGSQPEGFASKVKNHPWTQSVQGAVATWSTIGIKKS